MSSSNFYDYETLNSLFEHLRICEKVAILESKVSDLFFIADTQPFLYRLRDEVACFAIYLGLPTYKAPDGKYKERLVDCNYEWILCNGFDEIESTLVEFTRHEFIHWLEDRGEVLPCSN